MTPLELALSAWAIVSGVLLAKLLDEALRARFQLLHSKRIPATGNFTITLPKAQWEKGFKDGAFAFGIKDKDEQVIMTLTVGKGE